MKFSTRYDVEAPAEALFDTIADRDRIERHLMRRGAKLRRHAAAEGRPFGWLVDFSWRGKPRQLDLSVTRHDRPEVIEMSGRSELFEVATQMTVVALSRNRSRVLAEFEVKPLTMKARLLLQTAKLTKSRLDADYARWVAGYVGAPAAS